jgi:hypothetical protein
MFDKLLEGLASQGALGIMLGLLILMFVRFFNRTFDAQVERDRAHSQFMQNILATMQEIKTSCVTCRSDIITSEMTKLGAAEDRIIAEVRSTGERIITETRRDNDLSRPHAVGPTPSPVPRQPYASSVSGFRRTP